MIRIFIFSLLIGGPFSDFVPHAIAQTSASPVAHWKFDEGIGTVASDAAGNSDGSIIGAIWIQGAVGTALDFNGSGDHVRIDDSLALDFSAWSGATRNWTPVGLVTLNPEPASANISELTPRQQS